MLFLSVSPPCQVSFFDYLWPILGRIVETFRGEKLSDPNEVPLWATQCTGTSRGTRIRSRRGVCLCRWRNIEKKKNDTLLAHRGSAVSSVWTSSREKRRHHGSVLQYCPDPFRICCRSCRQS
ncbi:hypothetical protein V8C34DRAFT_14676 [Trichoderma compactum]